MRSYEGQEEIHQWQVYGVVNIVPLVAGTIKCSKENVKDSNQEVSMVMITYAASCKSKKSGSLDVILKME